MYKLGLPVDTREAAAIERRRAMEKQRQARIFNARERTMGVSTCIIHTYIHTHYIIEHLINFVIIFKVDLRTLEKQVQERKFKEGIDQERNAAFGKSNYFEIFLSDF